MDESKMQCPGCGMELTLKPVDQMSDAQNEEPQDQSGDTVSPEDQTMPLNKLKEKINKKAGY